MSLFQIFKINNLKTNRIGRGKYVSWFVLLFFTILFIAYFDDYLIYNYEEKRQMLFNSIFFTLPFGVLITTVVFCLIVLTIYRLHDLGFSGWWTLLLITFLSPLFVLLCIIPGTKGANKYGKEPEF